MVGVVAVGAAVAGMWKAIKDAKKLIRGDDPADPVVEKKQVLSAAIIETVTIQGWTEQNRQGTEQTRHLCSLLDEMLEEMRSSRSVTRDFTDEVRKLRLSIAELSELERIMRR